MSQQSRVVFSGVQPTSDSLHLGNALGLDMYVTKLDLVVGVFGRRERVDPLAEVLPGVTQKMDQVAVRDDLWLFVRFAAAGFAPAPPAGLRELEALAD